MRDIIAGTYRDDSGTYLVELEYSEEPAQLASRGGQTINHEPIPAGALEVSISGAVWRATKSGRKDRRYSERLAYGQVIDELRKVPGPRAVRIAELWQRWHLNGMRPNCAHMPDQTYTPGLKCPAGEPYESGTAWLFEPIPAETLAELRRLFGRPA